MPLLVKSADALESTLNVPPCEPDASPELLWAEIYKLRAAIKGPDGFETWYDAAVSERIRRSKSERNAIRYLAIRHYEDARSGEDFDESCDKYVDGWLTHLKEHDLALYEKLRSEI